MRLHFETRADRPAVFRMTAAGIAAAAARAATSASWTVNEDPNETGWTTEAEGLVTSNEILLGLRKNGLPEKLRWIHIIGAGIEPLLPLDWLPETVALTNNSGVHVAKTRESCLMALLMLNAQVPAIIGNQRDHRWAPIFTRCIAGRSLLVVGVGDMGGAAARAGRTLGMAVTGVRRGGGAHPDVSRMVTPDALDDVLPGADFVVLAAPLTPETRGMLDRRRIGLMKPGAGIFNIGRGGLLDHAALADALATGAISGAVLDVFDPEPLPAGDPLWDVRGVVVMPHVTSDDLFAYLPLTYDLVFANAARLARGEALANAVDPGRGY